ncbi:MAG: hypothetical protein LQ340_005639 [Diploschistes diacapsis]|nr:MAG: hypothetical protein LQ340_005639 [Diploschistes diacapsis]
MTTIISSQPVDQPFPVTPGYLLPKLLPLISDGSNGVRTQLVKLLQALPRDGIDFYSEQILLYTRAGMTHLAVDIRRCSLDVLDWAIEVCGKELVECPGGWVKMIKNFLAMLGWTSIDANSRWSSEWSLSNNDRITAKTLGTLAAFLELGFVDEITTEQVAREEADLARKWFPLRQVWCHMIPTKSHAYRHLNLFGAPRDEESEIYGDVEARQQSFRKYRVAFEKGLEMVKRAGGEIGRAGARTAKVIAEGMKDAPNDDREEIFSAYRRKGCKSAYQLCQEMYAS